MTSGTDKHASMKGGSDVWTGRTRGGVFGNWFFIKLVHWFGLRSAYVLLAPVCTHFLLTAPAARRSSARYLRRVGLDRGHGFRQLVQVYRHFFTFGRILLDRVVAFGQRDHPFSFEIDGEEHLNDLLDGPDGILLLSAHFGNWEVATRGFDNCSKPLNIVAYKGETQRIQRLLDRSFIHRQFKIIESDGTMGAGMAIVAALNRGEIVAMHADRTLGNDGIPCTLLGGQVRLPEGPFAAAAITGAATLHVFAMRQGAYRYRLKAYPVLRLKGGSRAARRSQMAECAQLFAKRLEQHLRDAPYQWLNFYDFWHDESSE